MRCLITALPGSPAQWPGFRASSHGALGIYGSTTAPLRLTRTAPGEACATFPLHPGSYKTGERRLRRGLAERRVLRPILGAHAADQGQNSTGLETRERRRGEADGVTDRRSLRRRAGATCAAWFSFGESKRSVSSATFRRTSQRSRPQKPKRQSPARGLRDETICFSVRRTTR